MSIASAGVILSVVGLAVSKKYSGGKWLSAAGLIIGIFSVLFWTVLLVMLAMGWELVYGFIMMLFSAYTAG